MHEDVVSEQVVLFYAVVVQERCKQRFHGLGGAFLLAEQTDNNGPFLTKEIVEFDGEFVLPSGTGAIQGLL